MLMLAGSVAAVSRRNLPRGLALAVFLWVSMTTFLRIPLPGAMPELTIHRLLLIVIVLAWLRSHRLVELRTAPLAPWFGLWIGASLVSLVGTEIDFVSSLKRFLDFVLETSLFYGIIATSLVSREDVRRILHAAWLGLLLVAALAIVERYTGFNPVDRFISGYQRDPVAARDILSTYQHRILLGGAMAMGVPLTFALMRLYSSESLRLRFAVPGLFLLAASCYFSFSRGPWLGLSVALFTMLVLGSRVTRKWLGVLAAMIALGLVLRPGVLETLGFFAESTADADSFKGGTFQYRLELWKVAFAEVSKSSYRVMFGYGPGAGAGMEIERELSYRGKVQMIESWDNHYAYILLQSGVLGLATIVWLYWSALRPMWHAWRHAAPEERDVPACLLATAMVLVFMMTNVLIFAKQLDYLFWTVIAAGAAAARLQLAGPQQETCNCTETAFVGTVVDSRARPTCGMVAGGP